MTDSDSAQAEAVAQPAATDDRAPGDMAAAPLVWKRHLAREQPSRTLLAALASLIAVTLAMVLLHSLVLACASLLLIAGRLVDFLFPVTYRLDLQCAETVHIGGGTQLEWQDVRRCYIDEGGIKLSPLRRASWLEAYRGVYLRFPVGNAGDPSRKDVIQAVDRLASDRERPARELDRDEIAAG